MATLAHSFYMQVFGVNRNCIRPLLKNQFIIVKNDRYNHMFRHLARSTEHADKYEYEVTNDPKEWEFVEKLMPPETVPAVTVKPNYSSGWRPASDDGLKHSYFLERTKNHMLPVYLNISMNGMLRVTKVKNIHGHIWELHDELKEHIESQIGKKIASQVQEGNSQINFRGDHVYYVEQWALSKGF